VGNSKWTAEGTTVPSLNNALGTASVVGWAMAHSTGHTHQECTDLVAGWALAEPDIIHMKIDNSHACMLHNLDFHIAHSVPNLHNFGSSPHTSKVALAAPWATALAAAPVAGWAMAMTTPEFNILLNLGQNPTDRICNPHLV